MKPNNEPSPYIPSSMDIIFLIHHATLELYGIRLDADKTLKLAELIHSVADGERTFVDSDYEKNVVALRREAKTAGVDLNTLMHEQRLKERNAARMLSGMPPLTKL
jgi:hypothetical protein